MGGLRLVAGAAVLSSIAVACLAEDAAPRRDLRVPDVWRLDEVVTRDWSRTADLVATARKDGAELPARKVRREMRTTYVRRCLEVGDGGALRRSLVRFDDWRTVDGPGPDWSLTDALIETTPDGWTLLAAARNPSRAARAWLDAHFGPGAAPETSLATLGATEALAAGATWETPCAPLTRDAVEQDLLFSKDAPSRVRWSFRLTGDEPGPAEGDRAVRVAGTCRHEFAAKDDEFDRFELTGEASVAGVPGAWHRSGAVDLAATLGARAAENGLDISIEVRFRTADARSSGGEAPERPVADPEAGPVVRVAAPEAWGAGTRFVEHGREETSTRETPVAAEKPDAATPAATTVVTWTAAMTCEDEGEGGTAARSVATFETWTSSAGGEAPDTSLTGSVVEVAGGTWKRLDGPTKLTPAARRWLDQRFGAGAEDGLRAVVTPQMPVVAGQEWGLDERDTVAPLRERVGLPMDPDEATAKARLDRVEGAGAAARAVVSYEVDAECGCVAGCSGANPLRDGTYVVRGTTTGSPADWLRTATIEEEATIVLPVQEGDTTRVEMKTKRSVRREPAVAVD